MVTFRVEGGVARDIFIQPARHWFLVGYGGDLVLDRDTKAEVATKVAMTKVVDQVEIMMEAHQKLRVDLLL